MGQILVAAFWTASTVALACLALWIALAHTAIGRAYLEKQLGPETSHSAKWFFGFAAIGLLVCTYQGSDAMLGWIPESWGHADADGEFYTLRSAIASVFAFAGGLALIGMLTGGIERAGAVEQLAHETRVLRRLVEYSATAALLALERRHLEAELAALDEPTTRRLVPRWQRQQYRRLISIAKAMELSATR